MKREMHFLTRKSWMRKLPKSCLPLKAIPELPKKAEGYRAYISFIRTISEDAAIYAMPVMRSDLKKEDFILEKN